MEDKWIPITLINQSKAENNCRFLSVTQETVGKLKMIRPGVYLDDPRLRLAKDLPTPTPAPVYSKAAIEATERAVALYKMMRDAKPVTALPIVKEEPKPMTFEEQITHDWCFNPGIRKEFTSQASYAAYKRAVRDGRCK